MSSLRHSKGKGRAYQLDGAIKGCFLLEPTHAQGALVARVKLLQGFTEEGLGALYCRDIPGRARRGGWGEREGRRGGKGWEGGEGERGT